jgi:hypothetical protein
MRSAGENTRAVSSMEACGTSALLTTNGVPAERMTRWTRCFTSFGVGWQRVVELVGHICGPWSSVVEMRGVRATEFCTRSAPPIQGRKRLDKVIYG